jgi:hypothetical protein
VSAVLKPSLTIEQFEAGQVDPTHFDHEAHVYVGWLYVQAYELAEAISRFDGALRRLTEQLGVPGKYHATITWLFLLLIKERSPGNEGWQNFRSQNEDLVSDAKTTLDRYYSQALLHSNRAREHFVLPDRLAS